MGKWACKAENIDPTNVRDLEEDIAMYVAARGGTQFIFVLDLGMS
jgi:hypothetical protein